MKGPLCKEPGVTGINMGYNMNLDRVVTGDIENRHEVDLVLAKDRLFNDGKWAMPGGWCEYNTTIMENTVKEAREEAGLVVEPVRLVAAHSNRKHNNPKSFFYITRFFVLCNVTGGEFKPNEETTDARYFDVDSLPSDLNDHKSSPEQIRLCLEALRAKSWEPVID